MCLHFRFFHIECLRQQESVLLQKGNLACSMIMISENGTPMTVLQGNGSSVQLQEARVPGFFIPKTIVICDTA